MLQISRRSIIMGLGTTGLMSTSRLLAQSSRTDLHLVRNLLADYFDKLAEFSGQSPPPGLNAANGYFVLSARESNEVRLWEQPNIANSSARRLEKEIRDFSWSIFDGFEPGLHKASGLTYIRLAAETVVIALPQCVNLARSVIVAAGQPNAAALIKIKMDVDAVSRKLGKKRWISSGNHPNGHIATRMKNRVVPYVDHFRAVKSTMDSDFGIGVCEIAAQVCDKLGQLRTDRHDPWLQADWQIGFQSIMMAGSAALRSQ